jgi:hypothetical protein
LRIANFDNPGSHSGHIVITGENDGQAVVIGAGKE